MTHAARALQSYDLWGKELNYGSQTYFFDHTRTWRASRMSDQPDAGATSETAQTWKTIHTKHTPIHTNKTNMEWWLRRPNDIRGPCGPKVSRHLSYRWGKTSKNLTQETCPDRGSNPGPLRDKRAPQRCSLLDLLVNNLFILGFLIEFSWVALEREIELLYILGLVM